MPKQDVALEIYYDSAWHDLVTDDDVLAEQPIKITRGQGDESPAPRPAQVEARLANDDDKFRTSNPESPLYGKAGRNTPVRVKVGSTVRGVVEASSWAADQTQDFRASPLRGRAWVDIDGGGLLQRIGQWSQTLHSSMYRQISSLSTLVAYWPGEDESGSSVMTAATPGVNAAFASDVTFANADGPSGSDKLMTLGAAGLVTGAFPSNISTTGWQIQWATDIAGADGTERQAMLWRTSNGYYWSWQASNASYRITVVDQYGTTLFTSATTNGGIGPGSNIVFRMKCSFSAGTWTVEPAWYAEGDTALTGFTDTFSGTAGRPTGWKVTANTVMNGAYFGQMLAVTTTAESLQSYAMLAAINGYQDETAGDRFVRLMGYFSLSYTLLGDPALSAPMGPQRVDTLPNLLKEIVSTEDALLFDSIDAIELTLILRNYRYRQTPALELATTDLPALPAEVTDDLDVHNIVTASQRDGGKSTAQDDDGPLGTQPPPDGVGEYRQTVDVNVADETSALPATANWWLRRGTVNLPRFPTLVIDLNAKPSIISAVEAVDVGSVITITGYREYVIRLIVLGWVEVIGTHTRTITFTCVPDQQFVVGEWDATDSLWDSKTTTLKTGVNSSATALTFTTASSKGIWSTTGTYDVLISGEQITVTSMGAASLVSGSYDQSATVTRSVNGISKSLSAGEPIHPATPGRWAL